MPTWEAILAALLFMQAPGKSIYSTVETTEGSAFSVLAEVNGQKAYKLLAEGEKVPTQCQQRGNVACIKPRQRDVVFNLRKLRKEWQRTETYDEGVQRYAVIAHAIHEVMEEGEWKFPAGRLWRYLVSIAYHESGFRRDIHTGYGSWAIGDCKWRKVDGPKSRERIPGTCRSHGLFQSLYDKPKRTRLFGFRAKDVIGADLASTKRATLVAAKHLDRIHRYCKHVGPRPFHRCVFMTYGGVSDPQDKRIRLRAGTYDKLGKAPTNLDAYVRKLLDLGESTSAKKANSSEIK